jgi:ABC-2 type transport system ATP-binding protein
VPDRTVTVATDDLAAHERFQALPQLTSVEVQGSRFTLRGRGEDFVTHVIHCIAAHRLHVTDFRTDQPTLEDVFLRLTGHTIRD